MEPKYGKGNMMTFPLEFAEIQEQEDSWNDSYLLPVEAKEIQRKVMEVCDKMEYDGSLMYDNYPDRVSVERIVRNICNNRCENPYYPAMVQVLLCKEMGCRKERRRKHKERMRGNF
ncbi:MAG: hypothetical protein J1E62_04395 [Lachnospiraceae bacterium]|nr:hypothetical protein [Lachnospiraceae bacterium]